MIYEAKQHDSYETIEADGVDWDQTAKWRNRMLARNRSGATWKARRSA